MSDKFTFSGTFKPGSVQGTYTITSTKCALHSDGETTTYPCQLNGTVTVSTTITGNAMITSADGTTKWNFTLTPITGTSSYKMKGKGTETDAPDPGQPPPKPYPANVTGKVTPNPAAGTVTGNGTVSESSTQP